VDVLRTAKDLNSVSRGGHRPHAAVLHAVMRLQHAEYLDPFVGIEVREIYVILPFNNVVGGLCVGVFSCGPSAPTRLALYGSRCAPSQG
jgi:hypothetical protein